jgi:hypothetical protein
MCYDVLKNIIPTIVDMQGLELGIPQNFDY